MANLTKAQQVRADKFLDKLVRTGEWGVITYRKFMENLKNGGAVAELGEKSSVKYDRRKYNRMGWQEQEEYDRKLSIMVPEYRIIINPDKDSSFYGVTKTEYNYFNSLD